jgi:hypothetical protein
MRIAAHRLTEIQSSRPEGLSNRFLKTCPPENSCFTDQSKPKFRPDPQDIRRPRFSFFHIQLSKSGEQSPHPKPKDNKHRRTPKSRQIPVSLKR